MRTVWITFDGEAYIVKLVLLTNPLEFVIMGTQEFVTLTGGAQVYAREWLRFGQVIY